MKVSAGPSAPGLREASWKALGTTCENPRMAWEREIEVCRSVAHKAGELALQHAARGVRREDKADDSPVTVADRECERLIVSELRAAFPDDGFLGEEGASHAGRSGRRWIVDPIDGTRDFVRGLGTWSNLIGL